MMMSSTNKIVQRLKSILLTRKTGINYLAVSGTTGQGITPLLDGEGKVVITHQI